MIKKLVCLVLLLASLNTRAQTAEMADCFRQEGKIYVVITVIGIVFVSIILALLLIERKISKLEKEIKEQKG